MPPGAGAVSATPKDLVRIHVRGSSVRRDGRWVVAKELDVKVRGGGVTLDFTEAVITQPLLRITAEVRGGGLRLITRPGIVVDAGDISVRGGSVTLPEPPGPGVPVHPHGGGRRPEFSGSSQSTPARCAVVTAVAGGVTKAPPLRGSSGTYLVTVVIEGQVAEHHVKRLGRKREMSCIGIGMDGGARVPAEPGHLHQAAETAGKRPPDQPLSPLDWAASNSITSVSGRRAARRPLAFCQ